MPRIATLPSVVSSWTQRDLIKQTVLWQIIGIGLMVCHTVLVTLTPLFYPVVILLIGWLFMLAPLAGLLVFFQILLFQNMIVSIFCSPMSPSVLNALLGTNFAVLVVLAGVSTVRLLPLLKRYFRQIGISAIIAIGLLVLYTAWGTVKAGPTSALTYFREFSAPIFLGIIGIEVGRVWSLRTVGLSLLYGAILMIAISLFEYCYPADYYTLINAVKFMQIKYYAQPAISNYYSSEDIVRSFTSSFFNVTGGVDSPYAFNSYRLGGTIMNPISNAYILAVLGITAIALRQAFWVFIIIPILMIVGVKGASILLLSSLFMYMVWVMVRQRGVLVVYGIGFSALYVASGIIIGLNNNDFHVLGFMGGVRSLLHNPIGAGIGVGGNLSAKAASGFHWTGAGGFVSSGADFALESAVGVLIYQMGVAAIAVLALFITFIWQAPLGLARQYALPKRTDIIIFAVAMITLNGVFQEEAYAPYAAGLIMVLAGVLIGNQRRVEQVVRHVRRRRPLPRLPLRRPATVAAR